MMYTTDDVRIERLRPLLPPAILMEEYPVSEGASELVTDTRRQVAEALCGDDDRLLVVVGPCSIHDTEAALEYGERLSEQITRFQEDLIILMRVYFEKPRTTVGWKGLINDPGLDNSFDINQGLRRARSLLLELAKRGVPAGTEFLDTITPQFIADLVAWGAIGARTTESQIHRELASGLSMPVGFKNGTAGSVDIAVAAIGAASHPHHFLSVTKQGIAAIVETRGNPNCHIILRGSAQGPNYSPEMVQAAVGSLGKNQLKERLMVDCSHGNSQKDHKRQLEVVESLVGQLESGAQGIFGVMLESHLVEGRQDHKSGSSLVYGQSITDACLGWEDTLRALERLAAGVKGRRAHGQ
ncbi:MAG: 3-deoxy-7-phosphoheptulonate synthase [Myxococcota bacterium]|nr:3-deoxy-7-phosphoheptulonate synthase [Myxococcota bacterium]